MLSSAAGSRELSGCATKVRDGIACRLSEPVSTLHRLRPYCSSNRTDRRAVHGRCMLIPPPPTALGRGDNWTMVGRRLSPYRSRASPRRKLPTLINFAGPSLSRASAERTTIPTMRLYCTCATKNPLKKPICRIVKKSKASQNGGLSGGRVASAAVLRYPP